MAVIRWEIELAGGHRTPRVVESAQLISAVRQEYLLGPVGAGFWVRLTGQLE